MSKIAEKKALEAYPPTPLNVSLVDYNSFKRTFYAKGYDQSMQDFLDKAERAFLVLSDSPIDKFEQFKNYMKNEM